MRRILHIDMDAFFAAVEQGRHPELKGRPVVIGGGGDPTQRGVVSTASYEARKYGVHSAMPLRTAYKLCPHAIFLPVDYKEYSRVSAIIKNGLREITPLVEDVGIDEAFLDISDIEGSVEDIAGRIKGRIMEDTGLTCSVGIGPNKLLAKMASDMRKPDGLTIISESDIEALIYPLPARKLWGVGPKTEAHLKDMSINTIGDISATPLETLIDTFGNSYGQFLYDSSRGIDDSPLVTHWEPKSCSRETTFQHDTDNWQVMARSLAELSKEVVEDLKRSGYEAKNITAKVRFSDFKTVTRAKTLREATDSLEEIRRTVFECFGRIELGMKVRLIGVRAGKLKRVGEQK